jgi:hypothetical protein
LTHQRQGELVKRIGQDNDLTSLPEPGQELTRSFQWPHVADDLLDIRDRQLVFSENRQPALHQGIVVRHFTGGDL